MLKLGWTVVLSTLTLAACCWADVFNDTIREGRVRGDKSYYARAGITAAQILRQRGYVAREYRFRTSDGYILTIIRGTNPLVNGGEFGLRHKYPIIFVHGSISSAPIWLVNSKGAQPQDWTGLPIKEMSLERLNKLIGHYDSARSMPMLAMNCGYEVWLLNRRGFLQSEERAGHLDRPWQEVLGAIPGAFLGGGFSNTMGLFPAIRESKVPPEVQLTKIAKTSNLSERHQLIVEFWQGMLNRVKPIVDFPSGVLTKQIAHTFDPDYWNFSFDEQAKFDFPQAIEFVLRKTGSRKVHVFTHSAAGPIALMALTNYPSLAHKIAKMIHWSSALNGGTKTDRFELLSRFTPFIQSYLGPIPFAFMTVQVQNLLQTMCKDDVTQRTLCAWMLDIFFGESHGQQPVTQYLLANAFQATSSHEIQHMFQMTRETKPRKFNFKTKEENIRRYGRPIPPEYDFSKIKLRDMAFYVGAYDALSSPQMLELTVAQLSVPYKLVVINETGIFYNHGGAFVHDETTRLTNLPSLKDIESVGEGD